MDCASTACRDLPEVGVVREDQYWIWLRDAVYFPKGVPVTYDRLIWKSELKSNSPGVAVLPILPSGHVVLNLNYRHATKSWELELPRGGIQGFLEVSIEGKNQQVPLRDSFLTFALLHAKFRKLL